MIVTAGSTSKSVFVYFVQDDSGTSPGEPKTGMLFSNLETGGSASYARAGAARVDFELITLGSASASYAEGGFILVDDTNMPGVYRVDVPNAMFTTGVDQVSLHLVADSGQDAVMRPVIIDIFDVDVRDAVRMGMTALPNVNAGSAGGVPTDTDANGAVRIVDGTGAREINTNVGAIVLVDTTTAVTNRVTANSDQWAGTTIPTPTTTGVPDVNVERWLDTLVTLSGALPDVNVEAMDPNSIATGVIATDAIGVTAMAPNSIAADVMAAGSIASGVIAAAALTEIEDEIWDALKSAHTTPNSFGDFLDIEVSSRLASADISLTGGAVDTVTAVTNDVGITATAVARFAFAASSPTSVMVELIGLFTDTLIISFFRGTFLAISLAPSLIALLLS